MFGDITVKSRPLRLAFLIAPENKALQTAIETNSTLWGGGFNPIIPLYGRPPKVWQEYPGQKNSVRDRVLGYIRAFDPDILVNCTSAELPQYLRDLNKPIITVGEIWKNFPANHHDGIPQYGVGTFELLEGIYKEFFEVNRRFPSKVVLPILPQKHTLFWASAVGKFPSSIQDAVERDFSKAIDIEKPMLDAVSFESIFKPTSFSPRRITRYCLETEGNGGRFEDSYGLFMDAGNFMDIVDYWNLRALGRAVIPIPKQYLEVPEFLKLIQDFIKSQFRINRHNPSVTYGTSIIRGSSSTMDELTAFAKTLHTETFFPDKPNAHVISLQHWYPRVWDEWAIGRDGATPDNVVSQTEKFSFPNTDGAVTFNVVKPDFVSERITESPRYANEIYPKFYGQGDAVLADVLPYDHGKSVLRVAGGSTIHSDEFRIGRTGLIHLIRWNGDARWKVPLAEDVFFAWLKDKGFEAELSSCGRLAKELYSQLDGWLHVLTHEKLLALFEKMNRGGEDGKGLALGEVKNELNKIAPGMALYDSLVKRGVFQLGYKTQCVHCQRASWHDLSSFATQLICPLCHKKLDAIGAVDSGNRGDWHLKTAGAFSVGNQGEGSYCVLLTRNFFERDFSLQRTQAMSFAAIDTSGKKIEADLGLLWQESVYGESYDGALFAECKSYNEFKPADFARMRVLAKKFPGAILVFATLRKTLKPREIKEIKRIYERGMKRWKTDRPLNPVLILTGQELFSTAGAPYCWDRITIPDWVKRSTHSVLGLCNATQAIYLGVPHWDQTWQLQREKKRSQRKKRRTKDVRNS